MKMIYRYLAVVQLPSGLKVKDSESSRTYKLPSDMIALYFDLDSATDDLDKYRANDLMQHFKENHGQSHIHIVRGTHGQVYIPSKVKSLLGESVGGKADDLSPYYQQSLDTVSIFHDEKGYHIVGPGVYVHCERANHSVIEL